MEQSVGVINQKIKADFVKTHVLANTTSIVEFILRVRFDNSPFTEKNILNRIIYIDSTGIRYTPEERATELKKLIKERDILKSEINGVFVNPDEIQEKMDHLAARIYDVLDAEFADDQVQEWHIVSPLLAEQLKKKKKQILYDGFNYYWGRTYAHQAIKLDRVIHEICEDMQILHGQKNQWPLE